METKIIDEQLEDKQQIVTYKYLTEKLDIHPNKAKQLLKDYVSKLTDNKKYSTTIVIGGTLKENDEFCIVLAYDNHVETMRRRFKQINFEHLYSIQPISRFNDTNNALYLVDNSINNYVNLPSSIEKKEKGSILINKQSVEIAMEIDLPINKETNITPNRVLNNINKTNGETKLDKIQKKKTGLDFFAKNNKNNNTKPEETEIKVLPKKTNSDFFTKCKKSNNSIITNVDPKKTVSIENIIIEDDEKIDVESPKKNVAKYSISDHETKPKNKSNKKKDNEKKSKNKNIQKVKRKRIQTFDSSDEEIDSEEEDKKRSEHVMDVEDEDDFVQPTPPRPTPRENRKKEKQTTTATFIDDDGFVCTSKEDKIVETECEPLENVNDSKSKKIDTEPVNKKIKSIESDPAVIVDKKNNKKKPSKNGSSQGMKQSSLTSFFKAK